MYARAHTHTYIVLNFFSFYHFELHLVPDHVSLRQDIKLDDLETNHFVLVHGGGFGAWCWYKTIALLEEGGFKVSAIDLTGSGIHTFDPNSITSLSQYVKPLTDFLEKLAEGEKVLFYCLLFYFIYASISVLKSAGLT